MDGEIVEIWAEVREDNGRGRKAHREGSQRS